MYDQVTRPRRSPWNTLTWVLAVVLSLAAVAGTVWVLTHDVPEDASAQRATQSTAEATDPAEAGPANSPQSPVPSPTPSAASPPPTPATDPEPPPPAVVPLTGIASGRCLDVPDGAAVDGVALQIYDCNGTPAQLWTASASGELRALDSMCLDDPSGGEPNTPVTVWTCHGGANQQWSPQPDGTVRNVATGLCLDVANALVDNGTPVVMYDCHARDNQQWSTS